MRIRRIAPILAVSAAATLVPAFTPATASAAADPLKQYLQQKPKWHRCESGNPAGYQCAKIKVPLDYSRPGGKKIELAISRIKTSTASERRGVLLLNPGGPGGEGLSMPLMMEPELPKSVKRRYDLIGFDPRGVGQSSPVSCGLTDKEREWQRPYKPATFAKDVKWARTVAEKCRAKGGDKLRHLTTRNTARDMDVIRSVLGEKKISYLGYSYGTYLGAVYTQMFPKRADRFVLDSAVDPQRIWRGMIQVWAEGQSPHSRGGASGPLVVPPRTSWVTPRKRSVRPSGISSLKPTASPSNSKGSRSPATTFAPAAPCSSASGRPPRRSPS